MDHEFISIDRRRFLAGSAALTAAGRREPSTRPGPRRSAMAPATKGFGTLSGTDIRLTVASMASASTAGPGMAIAINGSIPAPLIRLKEGQNGPPDGRQPAGRGHVDPLARAAGAVPDGRRARASAFPASRRAPPSPTNSRSSSRAPIGTTAIRGCRSSSAITGRSSSTPPGPTRSSPTASMSSCSATGASCTRTRSSR